MEIERDTQHQLILVANLKQYSDLFEVPKGVPIQLLIQHKVDIVLGSPFLNGLLYCRSLWKNDEIYQYQEFVYARTMCKWRTPMHVAICSHSEHYSFSSHYGYESILYHMITYIVLHYLHKYSFYNKHASHDIVFIMNIY